jgi:hypothetical protein
MYLMERQIPTGWDQKETQFISPSSTQKDCDFGNKTIKYHKSTIKIILEPMDFAIRPTSLK